MEFFNLIVPLVICLLRYMSSIRSICMSLKTCVSKMKWKWRMTLIITNRIQVYLLLCNTTQHWYTVTFLKCSVCTSHIFVRYAYGEQWLCGLRPMQRCSTTYIDFVFKFIHLTLSFNSSWKTFVNIFKLYLKCCSYFVKVIWNIFKSKLVYCMIEHNTYIKHLNCKLSH